MKTVKKAERKHGLLFIYRYIHFRNIFFGGTGIGIFVLAVFGGGIFELGGSIFCYIFKFIYRQFFFNIYMYIYFIPFLYLIYVYLYSIYFLYLFFLEAF